MDRCIGDDFHRFFACELLIDENTRKTVLPIVCTQCGKLLTHIIDVKKLMEGK